MSAWHEEEDSRLKDLWISNTPTNLIAREFPGRSKNSIIGRAHRLGLPPKAPHRLRTYTGPSIRKIKAVKEQRIRAAKIRAPIREAVPPPPSVLTGEGIPLRALRSHHCRDVIGYLAVNHHTSTPMYCGAPKHAHSSFCEYHYKLYCVRPDQRKR